MAVVINMTSRTQQPSFIKKTGVQGTAAVIRKKFRVERSAVVIKKTGVHGTTVAIKNKT